jgi:hypothetical protein
MSFTRRKSQAVVNDPQGGTTVTESHAVEPETSERRSIMFALEDSNDKVHVRRRRENQQEE